MSHGTVNWFQIDTDDPAGAEQFYGDLFGWTFAADPDTPGYQLATPADAPGPQGGIFDTRGESPTRAAFFVIVTDVVAAAEQAERLGGKVATPPRTTPNGLTFAHLHDPAGNHFGVYAPPAS